MKKLISIISTFILVLSLSANEDMKALKLQHDNHSIKKFQTWKGWSNKSIIKRIYAAPKNIVEYIAMDNKLYGYDDVPTPVATINPNFKKDLISAIEELPNQIKKQLQTKLIGIFILSGLGSTGFSEHIYKKNDYYGGLIILDQDVLLKLTANEWATWRINSAFKKVDDYALSLKIEETSQNTRKQAIQFILLHEIAHIIGLSEKVHPKTYKGNPNLFPFSSLSWISFTNSIYDKSFKHRKDIKFYRFDKSTMSLKDSDKIILNLINTDFCSLYASNNFFEDFAEAYTIYVHTILMKKPYSLKLQYNGKEIQSLENPFIMKKLHKKKKYFDNLFKFDKIKIKRL